VIVRPCRHLGEVHGLALRAGQRLRVHLRAADHKHLLHRRFVLRLGQHLERGLEGRLQRHALGVAAEVEFESKV